MGDFNLKQIADSEEAYSAVKRIFECGYDSPFEETRGVETPLKGAAAIYEMLVDLQTELGGDKDLTIAEKLSELDLIQASFSNGPTSERKKIDWKGYGFESFEQFIEWLDVDVVEPPLSGFLTGGE